MTFRLLAFALPLLTACAPDATSGTLPSTTSTSADVIADATQSDEGQALCTRWRAFRNGLREGSWSGSARQCEAGDVSEPGRSDTLASVNFYRELAGLPAVTLDDAKNVAAQHCALMMDANGDIQHEPPTSWACYDQLGADAAGQSNLATAPAVSGIDLFMTDTSVDTLGHRRWLLSNSLGPIGVGSTASYSCLHVIGGDGDARKRWTAWPPPGLVPYDALEHGVSYLSTDRAGWSIQSDALDLGAAEVTVTHGGQVMPTTTRVLAPYYGSTFAIAITPKGWQTEPGATYDVSVRGLLEDIDYRTTVLDCD